MELFEIVFLFRKRASEAVRGSREIEHAVNDWPRSAAKELSKSCV